MYLLTAATALEMECFLARAGSLDKVTPLVTGVGVVETATRLTRFLASTENCYQGVVNIGIGGAYIDGHGPRAELLDICLAQREVLGDLGVCLGDSIEPLMGEGLLFQDQFALDGELLARARKVLLERNIPCRVGTFVTVQCVSGSEQRGRLLADCHDGLCENMEGAAAARVCAEFSLPLLELRAVSNLVEDRDRSSWKIKEAASRSGEAAAIIVTALESS
ncbi:futalosine hydrolase [Desulfogranum mediterraneum]|uniref:futalosine hydrolase n=1 Tax=Desulfogranum mediterraneum TaxID=160661 RepID=UPI0003F5787B|nr:futalosine hydrolase [Desulfogranum mediterraneum]